MFRPLAPLAVQGASVPQGRVVELERQVAALHRENDHLKRSLIAVGSPTVSLSPKQLPESQPKKRRRLAYEKCDQCRRDRQACKPRDRVWPDQKCDRCIEKDFLCSESRDIRTKARANDETNDPLPSTVDRVKDVLRYHIAAIVLQTHGQQLSSTFGPHHSDSRSVPMIAIPEGIELYEQCNLLGEILLLWACKIAKKELTQLLLDAGININARPSARQWQDVRNASLSKYAHAVSVWTRVLKSQVHICSSVTFPARHVTQEEDLWDLVRNIAGSRTDSEPDGTPLLLALQGGCTALVKVLIEQDADCECKNSYGKDALMIATEAKRLDFVKLLLTTDAFFDVDKDGETALHVAASSGYDSIVRVLIESEQFTSNRPNSYGLTPLFVAVQWGHEAVVDQLLEFNVNISGTGLIGYSPIHAAAWKGYEQILRKLLNAGANLDAPDVQGRTPLWHAVNSNSLGTAQCLIERGANVKYQESETGRSLLVIALERRESPEQIDMVKLLIDQGADANAGDSEGKPPLYWIVYRPLNGDEGEIITQSLIAGADFNAKCVVSKRHTAAHSMLWHAVNAGHDDAVDLLLQCKDIDHGGLGEGSPLRLVISLGFWSIAKVLARSMTVCCSPSRAPYDIEDYIEWAKRYVCLYHPIQGFTSGGSSNEEYLRLVYDFEKLNRTHGAEPRVRRRGSTPGCVPLPAFYIFQPPS